MARRSRRTGRNVQALNGLGWVLWDLNRHGAAADMFQRSVDLHASGNGLSGLASAAFRAGRIPLAQAVDMLNAAISIDPNDGWSQREKGWLLRQAGEFDAAMQAFEAALAIYADDDNAHYGMGRGAVRQGLARGGAWQFCPGHRAERAAISARSCTDPMRCARSTATRRPCATRSR